MKLILTKNVPGVGQAGQAVSVSDAYARNYLLPRRLAQVATVDVLSKLQQHQEKIRAQQENTLKSTLAAKERLSGVTIKLTGAGHPGGHLYQSIHDAEILAAINRQYHVSITDVTFTPAQIKKSGRHEVTLKWPDNTTSSITVMIEAIDKKPS